VAQTVKHLALLILKVPPQIQELENLRGNPVVLYHWAIAEDAVPVLYECLRKRGRTDRMDLVLSTVGGSVSSARQIALLLREYTERLTILVPYQARSSGTLLCLSADELVLGPMSQLGPIDSQVGPAGSPPPDAPGMISAEDIRSFRQMAKDWFGVEREEDRLQVLALVAQRIFPTSLTSFYRFDKLVRQIADELLAYQLPEADASTRQRVVNKLVAEYFAHEQVLSYGDVRDLGLRVRKTSIQEEKLLWDLTRALQPKPFGARQTKEGHREIIGLIASADFCARRTFHVPDSSWRAASQPGDVSQGESEYQGEGVDDGWEIDM
jgi:hypothetical protein